MKKSLYAKLIIAAFLLPLVFSLFSACELIQGPTPSPPSDVAASTDQLDTIELTWTEVDEANIYYIYRSSSEEGEYEYLGFTYAGVYGDTSIAPAIPYWYRVTASDIETNNESDGSTRVEGNSVHEFAWSTAASAGTGAAQQRLTVDTADGSVAGTAYLGYAANNGTGSITVSKYNSTNGSWETLGGAFGTTDTNQPRVFDIAAYAGTVYAAYSDTGLGGKVTVKAYSPATGAWQTLGSEGFSAGTDARYISVDIDPATGTVYAGYISSAGFYIHNSGDLFNVGSAISAEPLDTTAIISFDGSGIKNAFEDYSVPEIKAGGTAATVAGINLRDGYMDFIAVSNTEMYIAYYTDALYVKKYNGSNWATDITPAGISAAVSTASVGLAYDTATGGLYLFYGDDGGGFGASGLVMKYGTAGWTTLAVDEDTDSIATAPSGIELAAYNNLVYASYMTAGSAQMRVWE